MVKNIVFLLALQLWAEVACAQFSISGNVMDSKSKEPLAGANVIIASMGKGMATDTDGNFHLYNIPEGEYKLKVTFIGYSEYSQIIQLHNNLTLKIALEPTILLTNEVIVSATRVDENSPTAFETVDGEEIKKQNLGRDMPYLLDQTPGVVTFSDAGAGVGYSGMRIRGSDPSRINVTINGIPLNDSESQTVFWVDIPDLSSSVKSVQIQRGVGTSTNGSGAFGASINIETGELKEKPYTSIDNSVGSFNTRKHTLMAGTGILNGKFNLSVRLSQISSDGYMDRASSQLRSYFISGGYFGNKSSLTFSIFSGKEITYQAWDGVSESDLKTNRTFNATGQIGPDLFYENQVDDYKQDHYQLHYIYKPNSLFNFTISAHYTKGLGYFEQYKGDDAFSNYGLPDVVIGGQTISSTDLVRRRWLDNDFYGATFSALYAANSKIKFTFGGAANRYNGGHFGQIIWARFASNSTNFSHYYDNTGIKDELNLYVKPEINLTSDLFLFGDIQFRNVKYKVNGIDNDQRSLDTHESYDFMNPKVGVSYSLTSSSLVYASYSRGTREPDRNDFIDAEAGKVPKHEQLNDFEIGFRRNSAKNHLEINLFRMNYINQLVLTGELNDVGTPIRRNVERSYRMGVELSESWTPMDKLKISGNVSYSINRIKQFDETAPVFDPVFNYLRDSLITYKNTDIILSPDWVAFAKVAYLPIKDLEFSLTGKYVGKQFLDNKSNKKRQLNDYLINDLNIHYTLNLNNKFIKEIRANLSVNNLFNVKYEPNGYSYFILFDDGNAVSQENYNYYYPQAGTNFLAGLSLLF